MSTQSIHFLRVDIILSYAKDLAESPTKSLRGILHDVQDDKKLRFGIKAMCCSSVAYFSTISYGTRTDTPLLMRS